VSKEITEDRIEEKKEEDKPLRFGDESGDYNDLFETSRAPLPIFAALPQYPASMKKQGIEGVVVIEIGVDETGKLLYGVVIRSLGREFDQAAVNWVRSIRFRPGMDRQGTPIRCRVRLPIRFRLED
jgi:protein TonB